MVESRFILVFFSVEDRVKRTTALGGIMAGISCGMVVIRKRRLSETSVKANREKNELGVSASLLFPLHPIMFRNAG